MSSAPSSSPPSPSPSNPAPFLVFVESNTTGSGMLAFAKAAALGFTPVLATDSPARYPGLAATGVRVVTCATGSPETLAGELYHALGEAAETAEIAGVTTTSEFYTAAVARVAADLGLPGNPPEAVATCRDKGRMRRTLAAARLPSPAFELVGPDDDFDSRIIVALSRIALPCVVKPVDDTGSLSVVLCYTPGEVAAHCRRVISSGVNVRGQATARTALIEGYLGGPEFSIETVSSGGFHRCVGITAKRVTSPPHFVERGHVFPAPLPAEEVRVLTGVALRALAAVGITHGATHIEMKLIDGHAYVVEINARPAGGMIPEVIARACGFDLLDAHLRAAADLDQLPLPDHFTPAGIAFLLAPDGAGGEPGKVTLREVAGVKDAGSVPGVDTVTVTAPPGSEVRPARSSYDRLGYVIAHAPGHSELYDTLDTALGHLRPVLLHELPPIEIPRQGYRISPS
ncbi:ATP-grasp domain-containing protein [Streptosporangium sp. NPDC002721]|uniref:ATP-grasp domain-containing protein n=1 Tax=Streptosporangium sp. NPDC002721 TaxID=3366188 RepID=UPI0036A5E116